MDLGGIGRQRGNYVGGVEPDVVSELLRPFCANIRTKLQTKTMERIERDLSRMISTKIGERGSTST